MAPRENATRREREAIELATWIAEKARRHAARHGEGPPEMLSVLSMAYGIGLRAVFEGCDEDIKRQVVDTAARTLREGAEKLLKLSPRN